VSSALTDAHAEMKSTFKSCAVSERRERENVQSRPNGSAGGNFEGAAREGPLSGGGPVTGAFGPPTSKKFVFQAVRKCPKTALRVRTDLLSGQ
jgi:hypothetical protein